MIAGNSADAVREVTREAFGGFGDATSAGHADIADVMESLKSLCRLKGVGPATASLILSVAYPNNVPFFADELFAWISLEGKDQAEAFWEKIGSEGRSGDGKSVRFDKLLGIKYTHAEYKRLYAKVVELRRRLEGMGCEVSASDIERAGYVVMQGLEVADLELPVRSGGVGSSREAAVDVDLTAIKKSKSDTESTSKPSLEAGNPNGRSLRMRPRSRIRATSPPQLRSSKRRKVIPD